MLTGMILAAGFGTRLQPHTNNLPKALVPFCGKPMIYRVIEKMKNAGIEKIVVNVHHKREKLIDYLSRNDFGVQITISDEKDEHLLTGGGIKNAVPLFGKAQDVLIHNTDIISSISYKDLLDFHIRNANDISLAIRKKNDSRVLLFDKEKNLAGWLNKNTGEKKIRKETETYVEFGFTGIYIISRKVFDFFPKEKKFDIIDFLLNPDLADKLSIKGYEDTSEYWFDLGSEKKIKEAEKFFRCG